MGHIIIEDAADLSSLVTTNDIAGNVEVTAMGGFPSIGPAGYSIILSWRELRH